MTPSEYEKRKARRRMGLCPVCGRWPREGTGTYCEECRPIVRKRELLVVTRVPREFVTRYCQYCSWHVFNGSGQPAYCPFANDCPRYPEEFAKALHRPRSTKHGEWIPDTWRVPDSE